MSSFRVAAPPLPGLDSLRGLAALAVVTTHVAFWCGYYSEGLLGAFAQRLEVGVAIFFALSGYLLGFPWIAAGRTSQPRDSVRRYLWKRGLRVLPVYWVTVVAALLLVEQNAGAGPRDWLDNLLLLQMFTTGNFPEGLSQMWSLATEVSFYVGLPLLAAVLTHRRLARPGRQLTVLAALSLAGVVWTWAAADLLVGWGTWPGLSLPAYLPWFAAGIALAIIDVERRVAPERRSRLVSWVEAAAEAPGSCWVLAVAVLLVASTPIAGVPGLVGRTPSEATVRVVLYAFVALALVVPSVFGRPDTTYARFMALPPLRHLGRISYSLFCCHVIVLAVVFGHTGLTVFDEHVPFVLPLVLALSLAISEVLYRLVERPFLRFKDRGPGRTTPAATTADTATHDKT